METFVFAKYFNCHVRAMLSIILSVKLEILCKTGISIFDGFWFLLDRFWLIVIDTSELKNTKSINKFIHLYMYILQPTY